MQTPIPNQRIRGEAHQYLARAGMLYAALPPFEYEELNSARLWRVAVQYDEAVHSPRDLAVQKAYRAFKLETLAQWEHMLRCGLNVHFKQTDPYVSSVEMMIDVRENRTLWIFTGGCTPYDHPLNERFRTSDLTFHHLFRAVHDYFGHAMNGFGFGPRGEDNAWRCHSAMYSPLARAAMTTETRGQNSWVNFGPHGEHNRRNPSETIYAPQKACLLPDAGL